MTRIVVLSAGLSEPSSTRLLADRLGEAVARELRVRGRGQVRIDHIELREHAHAVVDAMLTGFPAGELADVIDKVAQADAVIAVSPVFAASYSGLFKSFADILPRDALEGAPVLLGATAGSARHSLVLDHALRPLFSHLRAVVVPTAVFAATEDFGGGIGVGDGQAGELSERIDRAAAQLAALLVAGEPRATGDADRTGETARSGETTRSGEEGGSVAAGDPWGEVTPFAHLLARSRQG